MDSETLRNELLTSQWYGISPGNISYTGGNVGIGTNNPVYKFETSGGAISVTGTNNYLYYAVTNSTASGCYMMFDAQTVGGSGRKYQIGSTGTANNPGTGCFELYDATGGATRIVVDSLGEVGIGITNPTRPLVVKRAGAALTDAAIMVGNNGTGSGVRFQTYDLIADANAWMGLGTDMSGSSYEHSLVFPYGSSNQGRQTFGTFNGTTYSTKMTILGTGNVGIATNTPQAPLHIYKSGGGGVVQGEIRVCSDDGQKSRVGMYEESAGSTWGCWMQYNGNGDTFEFGSKRNTVDTSPQMTISSTGTVNVPGVITNQGKPMSLVGKNNGDIATGTFVFNVIAYNIGSMYSTSTGRWTASVAGYYQFTYAGLSAYTTTGPNMRWWKNGAEFGWGAMHFNMGTVTGAYHLQTACSVIIFLAVNDYVEFYSITNGFYGGSTIHSSACCILLG
jgi:hypothetical protein